MSAPTNPDDAVRAAAIEFADGMVDFWRDRLGAELLGVYLTGSLAHGGFNRRYSDIDMALITEGGISEGLKDDTRAHAASLSPELGPKLSLFWADREFSIGRFPPLDRVDYLDHAVPLLERERLRPERPSLGEIRTYLGGTPFANWEKTAARFSALDTLEPDDRKPYLRALLYPARFAASWLTGEMLSNDEAVRLIEEKRPAGFDPELIARAMQCRLDAADPDPLFVERTRLPGLVAACSRLMAGTA